MALLRLSTDLGWSKAHKAFCAQEAQKSRRVEHRPGVASQLPRRHMSAPQRHPSLDDALHFLVRLPLLAGKLSMADLQAFSQASRSLRQACVDAPAVFWQACLRHALRHPQAASSDCLSGLQAALQRNINPAYRLQPGTPFAEVARLGARGAALRRGAVLASCRLQSGRPPPCVMPLQPDFARIAILRQHAEASAPELKRHTLTFASPPHRCTVSLEQPSSFSLPRRCS